MFSEKEFPFALRGQDEWGGSDGGAEVVEEPEVPEEETEEKPEEVDADDDSEEDEFE